MNNTALLILYACPACIGLMWLASLVWFGWAIAAHVVESKRKGRAI